MFSLKGGCQVSGIIIVMIITILVRVILAIVIIVIIIIVNLIMLIIITHILLLLLLLLIIIIIIVSQTALPQHETPLCRQLTDTSSKTSTPKLPAKSINVKDKVHMRCTHTQLMRNRSSMHHAV